MRRCAGVEEILAVVSCFVFSTLIRILRCPVYYTTMYVRLEMGCEPIHAIFLQEIKNKNRFKLFSPLNLEIL